jgi:hypothetical protein
MSSFLVISRDELKNWGRASQSVFDDWIKEVNAKGFDGTALLKNARQLIGRFDPRWL